MIEAMSEEENRGPAYGTKAWPQIEPRPAHRAQFDDIEWALQQPKRNRPFFVLGDVLEFKEGGIGIVVKVALNEHNGWPVQYEMKPVPKYAFNPRGVFAWFYELDFAKVVASSAMRSTLLNGYKRKGT